MLHAIDTKTGVELWSFIPQDVIPLLRSTYSNAPTTIKHYALDGSVKVLKYDINGDGIVDASAGDRVIIYFGQGRGGSNYYAIDVTNRNAPKFMWEIGPTQLPGIGQAWSNPVLAKVNVGGGAQVSVQDLVLIFAGGYDIAEETETYASSDSTGNAIYMVDAVSGGLLWSAGLAVTGSTANLQLTRMDHSIPADVAVLDTNGDGFADRMYVGDMAGQLWRFDISNGQPPATLVAGGVIASLGAHDISGPGIADTRRFYNTPDVAVVQKKGQSVFMNIAIGSGYRGHPLRTATQDRMYAVRDYNPFVALTQAQYNALTPVTDAGLADITALVTPTLPQNAPGWKLLLQVNATTWIGEKVLVPAATLNNDVLFTTYTPNVTAATMSCQPTLGLNRFYAISAIDGSPVANLNNQNNTTTADRSTNLAQGGIAPSLAFLFPAPTAATDANGNALPTNTQSPVICMSGVEVLGACRNFQSRIKTYWNEADAP
jgi:type IV pilus assembly protein PilY1